MTPQKSTMTVLAQIASFIPDRIVENLSVKHMEKMHYAVGRADATDGDEDVGELLEELP